tara:strand:- start:2393 stop:3505 length:1113 start_codon:yes stop_codon:yes gene_type:complete
MKIQTTFKNIFENKVVFLTGHTGFQGSWMTVWLKLLGANVVGFSHPPPTKPSMFKILNLDKKIDHHIGDIRNQKLLEKLIIKSDPDFIIHFAAQALVRDSYVNPIETLETNIMGTANVLESLRHLENIKSCIIMTSDKSYENTLNSKVHKETDPMGGFDPYSSSKGASELIVSSYRNSFFNQNRPLQKISTIRAGNVLGGGDWAKDRIIPDSVLSLNKKKKISVRNPNSIRPWQFVLEPLSGILWLLVKMNSSPKKFNESWNFGPNKKNHVTVKEIVKKLITNWGSGSWSNPSPKKIQPHESKYLALDTTKAKLNLKWNSVYDIDKTIDETVFWYKSYYEKSASMYELTLKQITNYVETARKMKLDWSLS